MADDDDEADWNKYFKLERLKHQWQGIRLEDRAELKTTKTT
mgnify:CR=1 FL=1